MRRRRHDERRRHQQHADHRHADGARHHRRRRRGRGRQHQRRAGREGQAQLRDHRLRRHVQGARHHDGAAGLAFDNEQTFQITPPCIRRRSCRRPRWPRRSRHRGGGTTTVDKVSLSYPLNLGYVFDNDANTQNTTASQDFTNVVSRTVNGRGVFDSSFENAISVKSGPRLQQPAARPPASARAGTQSVTYTDSIGSCYDAASPRR